jgi:hypothetical protein
MCPSLAIFTGRWLLEGLSFQGRPFPFVSDVRECLKPYFPSPLEGYGEDSAGIVSVRREAFQSCVQRYCIPVRLQIAEA